MGPITLFDKSFLQSLTLDESVWFDHFFLAVVSPFFYVETLADLDKNLSGVRTPEQEVRIIADKFPDMHGTPCAFHVGLALANLGGNPVPMEGRIVMSGGRVVKEGDRTGVVFEETPESKAFSRWHAGEFLQIERQFASEWRRSLSSLPLDDIGRNLAAIGIRGESSRTLAEAKAVADAAVNDSAKSQQLIELALHFLGAPPQGYTLVLSSWKLAGSPPLVSYAPYAAFVLTVEIFFQVALSAGLISRARPSNRIDIAYLFYLPFCMVFVSCDRLHARSARHFLRTNQEFVWGLDLKGDLAKLNEHFSDLPDETKEKGVISFAGTPPKEGDYLVARLWDRHLRPWRDRHDGPPRMSPEGEANLIERLIQITKSPELPPEQIDFDVRDPDTLVVQRLVRKRKGSWWQVPKDLPDETPK